jgi:hypothetical protein
MRKKQFAKYLERATTGDMDALAKLREGVGPRISIFVMDGDQINQEETIEAWEYWLTYDTAPRDWRDKPTKTLEQAFGKRARLEPIHLEAVRPGVWGDLWDADDGHDLVAAVAWGIRNGHLRGSELELKGNTQLYLQDPANWSLLGEVVKLMKANEDTYQAARQAVQQVIKPPVIEPEASDQVVVGGRGVAQAQGGGVATVIFDQSHQVVREQHNVAAPDPSSRATSSNPEVVLHEALSGVLSLGELKDICFSLQVDYDNLAGATKRSKSRELIAYMKRRCRMRDVADALRAKNYAGFQKYFPDGNPF